MDPKIVSPQWAMLETRMKEVLKEIGGLCPHFILVAANPQVGFIQLHAQGEEWITALPHLLRKNPELKRRLTAALLHAHLMPESSPAEKN